MTINRAAEEIASECLCRRVRALSRRITAYYDEALRDTGLTANQLTVLVAVERAGEIAAVDLGELLEMEKSTISRTVTRMIDRGWLAASAGTARRRTLTLTAAGRELTREALPRWRVVQKQTREALGPELSDTLLATIR